MSLNRFYQAMAATTAATLLICFCTAGIASAQETVDQLLDAANGAFEANQFEVSEGFYEKALARLPAGDKESQRPKIVYNMGLCQREQGKFEAAIVSFREAIDTLPDENVELLKNAHLLLGKSLVQSGTRNLTTDAEVANRELTSATVTLGKLVNDYPGFEFADEAWYFQGLAFERLNRLEEARQAYSRVFQKSGSPLINDATFGMAWIDSRTGNLEEAAKGFREYLGKASEGPDRNQATYEAAAVIWQLSQGAAQTGDSEKAESLMRESESLLAITIADSNNEYRDRALDLRGQQLRQAGENLQAAKMFVELAGIETSPLRFGAAIDAGREYNLASEPDSAIQLLEPVVASADTTKALASIAAFELARSYQLKKDHQKAVALLTGWIDKTENELTRAELLLLAADNAMNLPGNEETARKWLERIVSDHPESPAVPSATYYLTWLDVRARDSASALKRIADFESRFADHSEHDAILLLKSEAQAIDGKIADSIATLKMLIAENADSPDLPEWKLRLAGELFRDSQFSELDTVVSGMIDDDKLTAGQRSEAGYWLAQLLRATEQSDEAIRVIEAAIEGRDSWGLLPNALGLLAAWKMEAGDADRARELLDRLLRDHVSSDSIPASAFRVGRAAFDRGDFAESAWWFQQVEERFPDSQWRLPAKTAQAWALLETGQPSEAETLFKAVVMEDGVSVELKSEASEGLAIALRQAGKAGDAVGMLEQRIAETADPVQKAELRYQLIVALVESGQPERVIRESSEFLKDDSCRPFADRLHYEMAWAYRDLKDPDQFLEQFRIIASDFPNTGTASEANFILGETAYATGEYSAAIEWLRKSLENEEGIEKVRENAAYRIGWAHFKMGEFDEAAKRFQAVVEDFPEGNWNATGRVMMVESIFAKGDFEKSQESFLELRQLLEDPDSGVDKSVRETALLHASQGANRLNQAAEAIRFAELLTGDESVDESIRMDAWLETGNALKAQGKLDEAFSAWEKAAGSLEETGARAYCMLGDKLFAEKDFENAIQKFNMVIYGFGGAKAADEIKAWRAYALYEAATCNAVQIETAASDETRARLIGEAKRLYQQLLTEYPDSPSAAEARKYVDKLNRMTGGDL